MVNVETGVVQLLCVVTVQVEGGKGVKIAPVDKESVRFPPSEGLDDVRRNTATQVVGRTADSEAVTRNFRNSSGTPDLVTSIDAFRSRQAPQ